MSNVTPFDPERSAGAIVALTARQQRSSHRSAGVTLVYALRDAGVALAKTRQFIAAEAVASALFGAGAEMCELINQHAVRLSANAVEAAGRVRDEVRAEQEMPPLPRTPYVGSGPDGTALRAATMCLSIGEFRVLVTDVDDEVTPVDCLTEIDNLDDVRAFATAAQIDVTAQVTEEILFAWAMQRLRDGEPMTSAEVEIWAGDMPFLKSLDVATIDQRLGDAEEAFAEEESDFGEIAADDAAQMLTRI